MSFNWRLASRLSVVTLAVLVIVLVALLQQRRSASIPNMDNPANTNTSASGLQGTDLGGAAAPDFRLTDQFGKQVTLSQFKGKPVVLTFLYTHCPDICPLTAEKLHTTVQTLGSDAQQIGIVAVSTDPARDTVDAALKFSKEHNMQDSWHYLVGSRQELTSTWSNYKIFARAEQQNINHSVGIYLIDKQGRQRVFMNNDFTPAQLVANLKALLKE